MAVNVDTLQITIEAEASNAATQVDALVSSLGSLQKIAEADYSKIVSSIRDVAKAAEEAMPSSVKSKKNALDRVSNTATPKIDTTQSEQSLDNLTESAEKAGESVSKLDKKKAKTKVEADSSDVEKASATYSEYIDTLEQGSKKTIKGPKVESSETQATEADAEDTLSKIAAVVERLQNAATPAAKSLETISASLQTIGVGLSSVVQNGNAAVETINSMQIDGSVAKSFRSIGTAIGTAAPKIEEALSPLERLADIATKVSGLRYASESIENLFATLSKSTQNNDIGGVIEQFSKLGEAVEKIQVPSKVTLLGQTVSSIAEAAGKISSVSANDFNWVKQLKDIKVPSGLESKVKSLTAFHNTMQKALSAVNSYFQQVGKTADMVGDKLDSLVGKFNGVNTGAISNAKEIFQNRKQATAATATKEDSGKTEEISAAGIKTITEELKRIPEAASAAIESIKDFSDENKIGVDAAKEAVERLQTAISEFDVSALDSIGTTFDDISNRVSNAFNLETAKADLTKVGDLVLDIDEKFENVVSDIQDAAKNINGELQTALTNFNGNVDVSQITNAFKDVADKIETARNAVEQFNTFANNFPEPVNLVGYISSLDALQNYKGSIEETKAKLNELLAAINEVQQAVYGFSGGDGFNVLGGNVERVTDLVAMLVQGLVLLSSQISSIGSGEGIDSVADSVTGVTDAASKAVEAMDGLSGAVAEFSSANTQEAAQNTANITENQQGQMELDLDAQPVLAEVDPASFEGITESVNKIRTAAGEAKTALEELKTAIDSVKPDGTLDGYQEKFTAIVTGVDNAEQAIQRLNEKLSSVSAGTSITDTAQNFQQIDSAIETTLKAIESLNTALRSISGTDSIGKVSEAISYISQKEAAVEICLNRLSSLIAGIDSKNIDTISDKFGAASAEIGNAATQVGTLVTSISSIPGAGTINEDADGIGTLGANAGTAAGQVDTLASSLEKLTVPAGLGQITAGAENVGTNSASAAQSVSALATSLSTFSLPQALTDFVTAVGEAAAKAGEAAAKVSELSSAIGSLPSTSTIDSLASDADRLTGLANGAKAAVAKLTAAISKFTKPPALSNLPSDIAYVGTAAANATQSVKNLTDALSKVSTVQSLPDIRQGMNNVISAAQDAATKIQTLSTNIGSIPSADSVKTLATDISNTGTAAGTAAGSVKSFSEALDGVKSPITLGQLSSDITYIGQRANEAAICVRNLTTTLTGIATPPGLSGVSAALQGVAAGAGNAAQPVLQLASNLSGIPDKTSVLSGTATGIGNVGTAAGTAQSSVESLVSSLSKIASSAGMGNLSEDIGYISSKAATASAAILNLADTLKQVSGNQSIQDVSSTMEQLAGKATEAWKAIETFGEKVSSIPADTNAKAIAADIESADKAATAAAKSIESVSDSTKQVSAGQGITELAQKIKNISDKAKTAAEKIQSMASATGGVNTGSGIPNITEDIKAVTRASQGAAKSLKSLSDRLCKIEPGTGLDNYTTSVQNASGAISTALQEVQALSDALSKIGTGGSLGTVNSEFVETKSYITDVINEIGLLNQALTGITSADNLNGVQSAFGSIADNADKATSGIDSLGEASSTVSSITNAMDTLGASVDRVSEAARGLRSVLEEVGSASKKIKTIKVKAAKGEDAAKTPEISSVTVEVPKPQIPTPDVQTVTIPVTADITQAEETIESLSAEAASHATELQVEATVDTSVPEDIIPQAPSLMSPSSISTAQSGIDQLTQDVTSLGAATANAAIQGQNLVNTLGQTAAAATTATAPSGPTPISTSPPAVGSASTQTGTTSASQAASTAAQAATTATQAASNAAQASQAAAQAASSATQAAGSTAQTVQSISQAAANVTQSVGSTAQAVQAAGQASVNAANVFNTLKNSIDSFGADTGGKMLIQAQARVNAMEEELQKMQERLALLQALQGHEDFEFPGMAEAESRIALYEREILAATDALTDMEHATILANAGVQNNGLAEAINDWNLFAETSKLAGQESSRSMKDASAYTKEFLAILKQYVAAQTYVKGLNTEIADTANALEAAKSKASTEGIMGSPDNAQAVVDSIANAETKLNEMRSAAGNAQKTLTDVGEALTRMSTGGDIELTTEQIKTMAAQLKNISNVPKDVSKDMKTAMKEVKANVNDTAKAMESFGKSDINTDKMGRSIDALQRRLDDVKSSIYNGNPDVENAMQQNIPMLSVVAPDYSEAITALNEFSEAHDRVIQKHNELDNLMSRAIGGESIPVKDLTQLANEYVAAQQAAKSYETAAKEAMSKAESSIGDARKALDSLAGVDLKGLKVEADTKGLQEQLDGMKANTNIGSMAKTEIDTASTAMDKYAQAQQAVIDKAEQLRNALTDIQTGAANAMPVSQLEDLRRELNNAVSSMSTFGQLAKAEMGTAKKAVDDASKAVSGFDNMQTKLGSSMDTANTQMTKIGSTASALQAKLSELSTVGGAEAATKEFGDAQAKVSQLSTAVDSAKAKIAEIRAELKTLADNPIDLDATDAREQIDAAAEKLQSMSNAYSQLDREVKQYAADATAATMGMAGFADALRDLDNATFSVDKMEREIAKMQESLQVAGDRNVADMVTGKLDAATADLKAYADAEIKAAEAKDQFENVKSLLNDSSYSYTTKDVEDLSVKFKMAENEAKHMASTAKDSLHDLESSINSARSAVNALSTAESNLAKLSSKKDEYGQKLTGLQNTPGIGAAASDTVNAATQKYAEFETAVKKSEEATAQLRTEIDKIKSGSADALPISQLKDFIDNCNAANKEANTAFSTMRSSCMDASSAVNDASKAVSGFDSMQSKLSSSMDNANTRMTKIGSTASALQAKLNELSAVGGAEAAVEEFGNAQTKVERLSDAVTTAKAKIAEIQAELQKLSDNPIDLSAADAMEQIGAASEKLQSMSDAYSQLSRDVNQYAAEATAATMGMAGFADSLRALDNATFSVDRMEQEIAKMRESLQVASERNVADMVTGKLDTATADLKAYADAEAKAAEAKQLFENAKTFLNDPNYNYTTSEVESLSASFKMAENEAKNMASTAKTSLHDLESSISSARSAVSALGTAEANLTKFGEKQNYYGQKLTGMQNEPDTSAVASDAINTATQKYAEFEAAVKKSEEATTRLRTEIEKIKTGAADALPISQLKDFVDNCNAADKAANAAFSVMRSSSMSARSAVSDVATSLGKLNTLKLTLDKQLGVAKASAERLDGSIASLKRKLDTLNKKGASISDAAGFAKAQEDISALETAATATRDKITNLETALQSLSDNPIDLNADDALYQIDDMVEKLKNLRHEYETTNNNMAKVAEQTAKNSVAAVQVGDTGSKTDNFSALNYSLGVLKSSVSSVTPIWSTLQSAASPAIDAIRAKLESLITACPELGTALSAASVTFSLAIASMRSVMNSLSNIFSKVLSAAQQLGSFIAGQFKKDLATTASALKSIATNSGKLVVSGFQAMGNSVKQEVLGPLESIIKATQTWMNSIGRIAFYRLVRGLISSITSAFKDGINNLYQYSKLMGTTFSTSMNSLATSAQYLKNSLAAMAAPLIEAVAPAIDYVVDKFVALFNIIGKVFAALTGKSVYTQAKKQAVEYGAASKKATDGAKDSAEELQKYLLGIDELNIIDDNDNNSGSGSGSGVDYGGMFEEVEIPNEIADWVEEIKKAMEEGDWYGVGKIIADKLNEIVDGWDAYAWGEKLAEKLNAGLDILNGFLENFHFTGLGSKVAELANGIIDNLNFDSVGELFANKLNALYDLVKGFVTTLHWEELGSGIAEAVNKWIDTVHWADIGYTWSEAIKGIFNMLATAISEINWYGLGEGIATAINSFDFYGVFLAIGDTLKAGLEALRDLLTGFNDTLEWDTIARRIYNGINDGFIDRRIEWESIGDSIGETFTNIFDMLVTILEGIHWYELGEDLQRLLDGVDWVSIFGSLSTLIADALNASIETLEGLVSDSSFWDGFSESLGHGVSNLITTIEWGSLFNSMVQLVIDALNAAITAITDLAGNSEFWSSLSDGMCDGIRQIVDNKEKWMELFENFPTVLADALNVAVAALNELTSDPSFWGDLGDSIGTGINNFITNFNWTDFLTGLVNLGQGILEGLIAALDKIDWNSLGTQISTAIENIDWESLLKTVGSFIITTLATALKVASLGVSLLLEVGQNIIEGLKDGIVDAFKDIGTWIKTHMIDPFCNWVKKLLGIASPSTVFAEIGKNIVQGLLNGVSSIWNSVTSFFTDAFNGIIGAATQAWEDIKTATSEVWGSISTFVSETWDNLKKWASEKFKAVKKSVSDAWDDVKDATSKTWKAIETSVTKVWDDLVSSAKKSFDSAKKAISDVWDNVKTTTTTVWNELKNSLSTTWEDIKSAASTKFDTIKSNISGVWNSIKSTADTTWNTIKNSLSTTWEDIKSAASTKFDTIKSNISGVWNSIKSTADTTWNTIKNSLSTTWESIKGVASTKFDTIKSNISGVWNSIKSTATTVWNTIKTTLTTTWETLRTTASTKFELIRKTLNDKWSEVKSNASTSWSSIQTTLSNAWSNINTTASAKFREISTTISNAWSNLATSAVSWGKDLCSNIASGISSGISKVTSAVSSVASKVTSYLGFSEPDEGPLSNFHTYMPDMMSLMANGIVDNADLPLKAINDVAESMAGVLSTIDFTDADSNTSLAEGIRGSLGNCVTGDLFDSTAILSEAQNIADDVSERFSGITEDVEFEEPQLHDSRQLSESFSPRAYMSGSQYNYASPSGTDMTVQMQENNDEVINALNAVANQIVRAINESGSRPIMLNGRVVSSSMTTFQNRANILYGKTQQNS